MSLLRRYAESVLDDLAIWMTLIVLAGGQGFLAINVLSEHGATAADVAALASVYELFIWTLLFIAIGVPAVVYLGEALVKRWRAAA